MGVQDDDDLGGGKPFQKPLCLADRIGHLLMSGVTFRVVFRLCEGVEG
jgi:hypothetical protein